MRFVSPKQVGRVCRWNMALTLCVCLAVDGWVGMPKFVYVGLDLKNLQVGYSV